MVAVNVTRPIYCCRKAARRMSTDHGGAGGAIVHLSVVPAFTAAG